MAGYAVEGLRSSEV